MSDSFIGLAIGIPLAAASVAIGIYVIRAMLQAADKPGYSPTVIPVVMLVGIAMLLYASNPEALAPLGDLAGVGLGGLVGLLVGYRQQPEPIAPTPLAEMMEPSQPRPLDKPEPVDDGEEEMSSTDPEGEAVDD